MIDCKDKNDSELAFKVIDIIYSQIVNNVKNEKVRHNFEVLKENKDYKFFDDIRDWSHCLMIGFIKVLPDMNCSWFNENFKIIGYKNDSEIRRGIFGYKTLIDSMQLLSDNLVTFVYNNDWEGSDVDRVFIKFMCGLFFLWFSLYKAFGFTFYNKRLDNHIIIVESERCKLTEEDLDIVTYHELGHIYYGDNLDNINVTDIAVKENRANHFAITCCKHFGFGKQEPDINIDLKPIMSILNRK